MVKKTSIRDLIAASNSRPHIELIDTEDNTSENNGCIKKEEKETRPKTYSEKLKNPKWQKKRLEIFSRDNWTCRICGDDKETLVVHHKKYIPGRDPWDYDDIHLITVCEKCHGVIEVSKKTIEGFDIDKVRAHCIASNDSAMLIYRYALYQPVIILKRGDMVAPSKADARKIFEILKDALENKDASDIK